MLSGTTKLSQSLILSSQNNNDQDMVYLKQIQALVEKNEKMIKEQEQIKLGIIKQVLKLQSILGYGPKTNDLKKSCTLKSTAPSGKTQENLRQTQKAPVFGGGLLGKEELSPTMQTSAENDSRTRDDTKVNNTLPTNEVSNPIALEDEKDEKKNGQAVSKRGRIHTVDERPREIVEPNEQDQEANDDYYTHKQLLTYTIVDLIKVQDQFLEELAPSKGPNALQYLESGSSTYSKRGKFSVYSGSNLSKSVNNRFQNARPGASTLYKQDNTVEIDDDGMFDDAQNGAHPTAGNDIPEFRSSGLGGPLSTEGNDQVGRRPKRYKSSIRQLHSQADILLTQSEMQIYDKFKTGREVITPRMGLGGMDGQPLSQSQRPKGQMAQSMDLNQPAQAWVPDTVQKNCKICQGRFYFLRRRHHCRQCGYLVCDKCSSTRDYVEGFQDKKQRICTTCNKEKLEIANKVAQYKQNMVMSAIHLQKPRKVNKK